MSTAERSPRTGRRRLRPVLCLAWSALAVAAALAGTGHVSLAAQPIKQLFHNEDCTNFFYYHPVPAGKAGEMIDRYVDVMAEAGVTVLLCNTNGRRTNYRSRVWDSFWEGYDPAGPDDQPFLAPLPRGQVPAYRKMLDNMLAVDRQGIDYPARVIQRCRRHGISPWISLRMNDCHNNDVPAHPFHGSFWKKNPQFCRKGGPRYFANCLDYAHPQVRDFYRALIVETLDRYDVDGLELDFLREPYLFSAGKEAEGSRILTAWMRSVHKLVAEAAAKRGHAIRLGVRVPSHAEAALGLGLDAITWAREGLIDLLVVAPRWGTVEFDVPIPEWRKMLGGSPVTLAGGLEVIYRPHRGMPLRPVSPELAAGAAVSVLSQGADAVYLFNYFQDGGLGWSPQVYRDTLKAMTSLESLVKLPRCVAVTYRDVTAPGENYRPPLPATGEEIGFSMNLGPVPDNGGLCELLIEFSSKGGALAPLPAVSVDGAPGTVCRDERTKEGRRVASFRVPAAALAGAKAHQIRIAGKGHALTIQRVELSLGASRAGRAAGS